MCSRGANENSRFSVLGMWSVLEIAPKHDLKTMSKFSIAVAIRVRIWDKFVFNNYIIYGVFALENTTCHGNGWADSPCEVFLIKINITSVIVIIVYSENT